MNNHTWIKEQLCIQIMILNAEQLYQLCAFLEVNGMPVPFGCKECENYYGKCFVESYRPEECHQKFLHFCRLEH